ncbi:MAG: zinc ribbon domain-containing protein, partial [Treponema sp.]|nr:zinc ribbon domain-containing protein [Treponema sp.]
MFCVHCGKIVEDGSAFCTHCGKPVKTTSDEPVRAVASSPSVSEAEKMKSSSTQAEAKPIQQGQPVTASPDTSRPIQEPQSDEDMILAFKASCKHEEYFYAEPSIPSEVRTFAQSKLAQAGGSAERILAVYDYKNSGKSGFVLTDTALYHFGAFMQPTIRKKEDCRRVPFRDISKIRLADDGTGTLDDNWAMQVFIGDNKIAD